jgi:hypothetical protein
VQCESQLPVHLVEQGRLSNEVQAEVGLDVAADIHGEVANQGLLIHAAGGHMPLPSPALPAACPVVVDLSLTQRRASDMAPAERATAPASPACVAPNLVVRSLTPSGCVAPVLASPLS